MRLGGQINAKLILQTDTYFIIIDEVIIQVVVLVIY
jgi:hypothetical protein